MLCELCEILTIYEAPNRAAFVINWSEGTVSVLPPSLSGDLIRLQSEGSEDRFIQPSPCEFHSDIWSFRATNGPLPKGGRASVIQENSDQIVVQETLGSFTLSFSVWDAGRGIEEFTISDNASQDKYQRVSGPALLSSCRWN